MTRLEPTLRARVTHEETRVQRRIHAFLAWSSSLSPSTCLMPARGGLSRAEGAQQGRGGGSSGGISAEEVGVGVGVGAEATGGGRGHR